MIKPHKLEKVRKFMEGRTLFVANYEIAYQLNMSTKEVGCALAQIENIESVVARDVGGRMATLYRYSPVD